MQGTTYIPSSVFELRAEVLKALAHPDRLRILDALSEGERCVCDLGELVGSSLPTVSRHLAKMRSAGLLASRRDGNQIYYRLRMPCLVTVFACIDEALKEEAQRRAAACGLQ